MNRPGLGIVAQAALEALERAHQVNLATLAAQGSPAAQEGLARDLVAQVQEGGRA
jgi:hypothetical protein